MDAAVGIPPRRAGRSGGFFKSSETSSTTLGSKDDKRPPLPPPSARDRLAGLNFTIQSLVEKARKRCNFGKTQSAAKLNPSAVIVNGGKTTTVNNISNNNVVHLRSSTSSPVLNLGNGGLAAKRRSGGAWGLGVNGNGHSNGAESPSSRTPSTSSSGAEDSDLTNDDDEDSEKDDDADVVNPQFSFTELRERWKERERVVENRKSYVRRVSSTVSSVYRKNLLAGCNNRVFDCVLVVGLYHDTRRDVYKPFVRKVFPSDAPFPENIALFCFPDACNWRGGNRTPAGGGSDSASSLTGSDLCGNISACNSYSIVLTSEKGERTFGYCRRIVPGSNPNPNPNPNRGDRASDAAKHHDDGVVRNHAPLGDDLPLAYCVLSKYRSHGFYDKFLSVLTSCHGCADAQMQTFLTLVGRKAMPSPGQSLVLPSVGAGLRAASPESSSSSSAGGTPNSNNNSSLAPAPTANGQPSPAATIARAYDERLEESDLAFVVANLDHSLLLKIFGAILLERKVLLASTSMKKLSSCIQGLSGLLYPFSWEHVLVPILPITLKDVVAAPSPFLIGLLVPAALQQHSGYDFTRDLLGSQELNSEGLMVVDLDKNRLVQSVGDESTILPRKVRKCLTTALSLVSELTEPGDPARNVLISEIFISVFVELCGHYKSHIVAGPDGKRVFQADTFLAAVKNSSSRLFLAWFVETAMFSIFIDNRILQTGSRDNDLFDYRVLEQQSDGGGKNIFKTMKQFSKTVKTMSDKWREWKASNGQISSPVS